MTQIAFARTFDSTDDYLQMAVGGLAAAWGPLTVAAIIKPIDENANRAIFSIRDPNGFECDLFDNSAPGAMLYFDNSTFNAIGSDNGDVTQAQAWQLVVWTKPTGNAAVRCHRYIYSSTNWIHANFGSEVDPVAPTGASEVYLGATSAAANFFNGMIACVGVWRGTALSDVNIETLPDAISDWETLSPSSLWLLDQSDVTTTVEDRIGTSDQTARVGTTATSVADLPFDVGGAAVEAGSRKYKRLYGPAQLGTSAVDLYTVPADQRVQIRHIYVNNPSAGEIEVTLSVGADAAATRLLDQHPVAAGGDYNSRRQAHHTLAAGEKIQGFSDTASAGVVVIDGYVEEI